MKKLMLVVFLVILLSGCVSQKSLQMQKWRVEYLENNLIDAQKSEAEIKTEATKFYSQVEKERSTMRGVIGDLIQKMDPDVADEVLKKWNVSFVTPDGKTLGKKE